MKKSKIIIFTVALALLMFANIKVTLFDSTNAQIEIQLNNESAMASETDHLFEMPPDGGGGGSGLDAWCFDSYYGSIFGDIFIECKSCHVVSGFWPSDLAICPYN